MRRDVNIPIGLIIIAILALLLALAWLFKMEIPRRESERYQSELLAEAELLSRVQPVKHGNTIMLPVLDNGDLRWVRQDVQTPQAQAAQVQTPQAPVVLDETPTPINKALDIARQIVIASLERVGNGNRILPANQFTSQKTWDRGVREMKSRGIVRAESDGTYPALGHDLAWVLNQIESEMNLTGAINALPKAKPYEQRVKLAGNGNGNA